MLRLVIATALLAACSSPRADRERPAANADAPLAAMAMGYDAGDDADIAAAQAQVRTAPRAAPSYASLSRAFLAAKRRRGDAVLLAYASDAVAAAEALEPASPSVLALRGVLLAEDHRFTELAALADRLISAAPADSTGYLLLGDARLELGDYDAAAAAYEGAMERRPDLRIYARGAHLRWLHGDIEGAIEMMDAALESAAGNREHLAWCITDLGQMILDGGDSDRAVAAADKALILVAGYPPARALRARAEHARGNSDAAAADIEAVIAVRSSAADHFLRADIELARGNREASAAAAEAGLALASHDPLPAAMFLARHDRDPARAVALTEREATERPTIAASAARALALHRAGRHDDAAAEITRALRLGTPLAELHLSDGLIRVARNDLPGARESLRRARDINRNADPRLTAELERALKVTR